QAKKGASEVQNFFSTLSLDAFGLAHIFGKGNLTTADFTKENIEPVATYIIQNKDYIKKITFLSPLGRELIKFDPSGEVSQENLSYEVFSDPFKAATAGTTAISKVYFIENTLGPYVDMFAPVFSGNGKVVGVIKTQVSLSKLQQDIANV